LKNDFADLRPFLDTRSFQMIFQLLLQALDRKYLVVEMLDLLDAFLVFLPQTDVYQRIP